MELEGDQFRDFLEDLSQGTGAVDVFEDAAAPPLDVRPMRPVWRRTLRSRVPASGAHGEYHHEQQADEEDEVANVEQGRAGDDRNIVKGAQQDIERDLVVELACGSQG